MTKERKERRTIAVDPGVWKETRDAARKLRVSASWVSETALREYLKRFRKMDGVAS